MTEREMECLQKIIFMLDYAVLETYYPDRVLCMREKTLETACLWLYRDMVCVFLDETLDVSKEDMEKTIQEFLQRYSEVGQLAYKFFVEVDKAYEEASIRKDWDVSLNSVFKGSYLSQKIGFSLRKRDLKQLALLHKEGTHRVKIEALLEACSLYDEYDKFSQGNYKEFLQEEIK